MANYPGSLPSSAPATHQQVNDEVVAIATELDAVKVTEAARDAPLNAAWVSYAPTVASMSVGNGTLVGAYKEIGKTVYFRIFFTFGTTSAVTPGPTFSLPVAALNALSVVSAAFFDSSASTYLPGVGVTYSTTTVGPVATGGPLTSTIPFTWATGDTMRLSGFYEKP